MDHVRVRLAGGRFDGEGIIIDAGRAEVVLAYSGADFIPRSQTYRWGGEMIDDPLHRRLYRHDPASDCNL